MARGPDGGLCESCRHRRVLESARGSRFLLCRMAEHDAAYRKYPALPVTSCPGYGAEPRTDAGRRQRQG
ncbi:MAG: hypothetical protein OXT09_01475 [Myxococcales bacterium]|nr:hypothetical protein [Myxococcales bacterium]